MSKKQIAFILILAACGVLGIALLLYEWDARQVPPLVTAAHELPVQENTQPVGSNPPHEQPDQDVVPQNTSTPSEEKTNNTTSKSIGPNTIIIRGKAFSYKSNVDEATLKKNIGWMDSSARPGEQGICIFMGHRNGQLRILKDVKYGDVITIVDENNTAHAYTVISGEVIETGAITHAATDEKKLVLITCYPFYYSGSAPHQYVVTAIG
ncbi:sortase [Christensenellaceae bacterium OttesenSCG-928-M15]|nr:sortase [Christensenellaceae bacterium OttesenSCG-928-M15]